MIIACATERKPKLDALTEVLNILADDFGVESWTMVSKSIDSGVSETPISESEIIKGAVNRAYTLKNDMDKLNEHADFYIGMEGGFHQNIIEGKKVTFIQGWAAVYNGSEVHFGSSPNLSVPEGLARSVFENGDSLGIAIDKYSDISDVRSNQGVFGVLTNDKITRKLSFKYALISAFAPFFNRDLYES